MNTVNSKQLSCMLLAMIALPQFSEINGAGAWKDPKVLKARIQANKQIEAEIEAEEADIAKYRNFEDKRRAERMAELARMGGDETAADRVGADVETRAADASAEEGRREFVDSRAGRQDPAAANSSLVDPRSNLKSRDHDYQRQQGLNAGEFNITNGPKRLRKTNPVDVAPVIDASPASDPLAPEGILPIGSMNDIRIFVSPFYNDVRSQYQRLSIEGASDIRKQFTMRLPGKKLKIDGVDFTWSDVLDGYKCHDLKWTYNGNAYKVRIETDGKVAYIEESSARGIKRLFERPAEMSAAEHLAEMQAQEAAYQASLPPEQPAPGSIPSSSSSSFVDAPVSSESPSSNLGFDHEAPVIATSPISAAPAPSSVAVVDDPKGDLVRRISDLQQQITAQSEIRTKNYYSYARKMLTPKAQQDAYWAADSEIKRITAELADAKKSLHELKD
jgi:hypothetical protein